MTQSVDDYRKRNYNASAINNLVPIPEEGEEFLELQSRTPGFSGISHKRQLGVDPSLPEVDKSSDTSDNVPKVAS